MIKQWEELRLPTQFGKVKDTGVDVEFLKQVSAKINDLPEDINVHKTIQRIYAARREAIEVNGSKIDFAGAEALAFSTLLHEGYGVRVSG